MTSTQDTSLHLSLHFNSHAHVERDVQRTNRSHKTRISTHTLTWSVTLPSFSHSFSLKNFNSHAHVERDGTHQKTIITEEDFNSHAHVERDDTMVVMLSISRISTHTLTWSVTVSFIPSTATFTISTHTLTWSVTARHRLHRCRHIHFNSHAHVERDQDEVIKCQQQLSFQLTRSRGA